MSYENDSAAAYIEKLIVNNPILAYLEDDFPEVKVIVRADFEKSDKVAVVSTGSNNLDPLAGNTLSAAVFGDSFSCPSTNTIVAAIKAVTTNSGCLLLVKESQFQTFRAASKKAKELGYLVDILSARRTIQTDTIAAAGAAAAKGMNLYEVKVEAKKGLLSTKSKIKEVWNEEKKCHHCGADSEIFTSHKDYTRHTNEKHKKSKF